MCSDVQSTGCKGLLRVLSVVSIMILVLLVTSCRTQETAIQNMAQTQKTQTTQSRQLDSASLETETSASKTLQAVAADTTQLEVTTQELDALPDNANFTAKKGRTRISVTRQGNKINISAITDSLQREVEYYRYSATAWKELAKEAIATADSSMVKATHTEVKEHRLNDVWKVLGWLCMALVAGWIFIVARRFREHK